MNDLSKKWKKTGLLEELYTDQQYDFISERLEEVVEALYECSYDGKPDERLPGLVLPVMRRIYDSLSEDEMPSGKWLVEDCNKYFTDNRQLYNDLLESSYIALDGEAEFCMMYFEDVVKRLKK